VIKFCILVSTGYTVASFEVKYFEIELLEKLASISLDVKTF